ncbi:MAG: sigma 54-interacting transcriptional regulator [Desulfobacteraceae bacterium]|nr:sigma 54-interacting transcriptional regulator [Desulfobacteraceae bacterium]
MKQKKLNQEERRFFKTVYHAAFASPFSTLREKLDLKIAGLFPSATRRESIDKCIQEIDSRIKQLEIQGRANINSFLGRDQTIMKIVFLFDIFHKFRDDFDQLILDQINAEDKPVEVSFGNVTISLLQKRGFSAKRAIHYLGLTYQLRRAFYFISTALVGTSSCMIKFKNHLWNNIFTDDINLYDNFMWNKMEDFSTLLLGETGTGKGTAAMAIGRSGFIPYNVKTQRFEESFMHAFNSLNLSQFPEALLESELFGHKKGAFTGAVDNYQGVFDRCSPHGSIFLDEIGEIPNHVQIKLLQVLQERIFTPVGSHVKCRFQGRVIAATNKSVKDILSGKVLRDDFYYRLCSDIIEVPPLSERIKEAPAELDTLLAFTVDRMTGTKSQNLIDRVKRVINKDLGEDYTWPGNVRELEQCVRSVLLKRSYQGEALDLKPPANLTEQLIADIKNKNIDIPSLISGYCTILYEHYGTYEKVARKTGLDRRTIKKHIDNQLHTK